MQQAFNVDTRIVTNRNVLLVDDLLTSGATMIACAEALFAGGAESVFALAIARA
jgi:predicted amidophosphoribosyltransferase